MIMGGRKALFNLDRGELFKGTTPQVLLSNRIVLLIAHFPGWNSGSSLNSMKVIYISRTWCELLFYARLTLIMSIIEGLVFSI